MAKTVIIGRHGRKDKDGKKIAEEQIKEIEERGITLFNNNLEKWSPVYIHPGSAIIRTEQTIMAWEKYAEKSGEFHPIMSDFSPDPTFGSDEIFAKMLEYKEHFESAGGPLRALQTYASGYLSGLQLDMSSSLADMFDFLFPGEAMLMVGHTPMVEALAVYIDPKIDASPLKELEGYIFTQGDDGLIQVKRA